MLLGAEVLPLCLHLAVQLQLGIAFGIFEAQLLVDGDEVGEEQGIDTFVLVFGFDGNQQQVEHLGATLEEEGLEQVVPAEG